MGGYVTINPTPSGDITGSGTANYIAMFQSANVIGDSIIYQSANASDATKTNLNVVGNLFLSPTASTTGAVTPFTYTGPANTGQTASTEIYGAYWNMGSRQWATGNFATQREINIVGPTYSFVASSTITNAYTVYITEPTAGTNAAFSNTWGLGVSGGVNITGRTNIGNYATPSAQRLVTIGQDTAYMSFGSYVGGTSEAAIYVNQSTPGNNYVLRASSSTTILNGNNQLSFASAHATQFTINRNAGEIVFNFTPSNISSITASAENPNFKVTGNTKTWAAGAITTQRWNYLTANTAAFASASTITNSYGLYVEKAVAGSNATITNNYALGTNGNINITNSTATPFLYITASTNTMFLGGDSSTLYLGTVNNNNFEFYVNNLKVMDYKRSQALFTAQAATGGANPTYRFTVPNHTGLTASTEVFGFLYTAGSYTWNSGAIITQREFTIGSATYNFAAPSTITNAYSLYVNAPSAGTNATITNNYAAGFSGAIKVIDGTASVILREGVSLAGYGAIYGSASLTPSAANMNLLFNTDGTTYINAVSGKTVIISNNTNAICSFSSATQTYTDAINITFGSTTGSKLGTATTQKLSFWNATPIVQPANTVAIDTLLVNTGLRATGAYANFDTTINPRAGTATANTAPLKFTSGTNLTVAEAGATEYNGNFYITEASTQRKSITGCIYTQTTSVTVANSVAETSILTATSVLPANFFIAGKTLRIKISGYHSAVSNPNGTVIIKLGSTTILTTGAVNITNGTNDYFEINAEITCRSTGVSGTVIGQGRTVDLDTSNASNGMVNTATTTIDTTASQTLDVTWTWGTASASNTITFSNGFIEVLN